MPKLRGLSIEVHHSLRDPCHIEYQTHAKQPCGLICIGFALFLQGLQLFQSLFQITVADEVQRRAQVGLGLIVISKSGRQNRSEGLHMSLPAFLNDSAFKGLLCQLIRQAHFLHGVSASMS